MTRFNVSLRRLTSRRGDAFSLLAGTGVSPATTDSPYLSLGFYVGAHANEVVDDVCVAVMGGSMQHSALPKTRLQAIMPKTSCSVLLRHRCSSA